MLFNYFSWISFCDAASPWQLGFQDPATATMHGIVHLHNNIIFYLILIAFFVCWLLLRATSLFSIKNNRTANKSFTHSTPLEIVWTITPAALLLLLASPSFALLYAIGDEVAPEITIKVVGHQWYWSYEYADFLKPGNTDDEANYINFDSYITPEEDLEVGHLRLLEVDKPLVLPTHTHIHVLINSADVLHSWAVPSLGVKIDACPGRLNIVNLNIERPGVFYGQCSEICGVNHGFMPIVVHAVDTQEYLSWVAKKLATDESESFTSKIS